MRFTLLVVWTACAWAQSGIEVPTIGEIVDSSGALRPVYGVPGSFWIGPPSGVIAVPAALPSQADWMVAGEVLSFRVHNGETEIAVRRDRDVWIVHQDGSVVAWIGRTTGPVLLLPEIVVFATGDEIVLRHGDGSEVRLQLAGAESIVAMGPHYAAIRVGDVVYALRTESGRESLFILPGTAP